MIINCKACNLFFKACGYVSYNYPVRYLCMGFVLKHKSCILCKHKTFSTWHCLKGEDKNLFKNVSELLVQTNAHIFSFPWEDWCYVTQTLSSFSEITILSIFFLWSPFFIANSKQILKFYSHLCCKITWDSRSFPLFTLDHSDIFLLWLLP